MPKKPVRNAYYYFMQEQLPILRRQGQALNGLQEAATICREPWKALHPREKETYERMAKDAKGRIRGTGGRGDNRLDNVGNVIADRVNPEEELFRRQQRERNSVKSKWPPGKALVGEKFYFIDVQVMCEVEDTDYRYLPCEIALVEYSLKSGVTKCFQKFIDYGRIPLGYRFVCQQTSEETHKIPIENFDKASKDHMGTWLQIENFINPNREQESHPPVFCLNNKLDIVQESLKWIYDHALIRGPSRITKVYGLEGLVIDIFQHIGCNTSEGSVYDMLTTSAHDYENGVVCDWHDENETRHCSLGICRIYAFVLSDALCVSEKYDFRITPKHLPLKSSDGPNPILIEPSRSSFEMPSFSKPSSRHNKENDDDFYESEPAPATSSNSTFAARDFRLQENPELLDAPAEVEPQLSQSVRRPTKPSVAGQMRQPRNLPPGYKPLSTPPSLTPSNNVSNTVSTSTSTVVKPQPWSKTVQKPLPTFNNTDFPTLGGVGRGVASKISSEHSLSASSQVNPLAPNQASLLVRPGSTTYATRGIGRGAWNMSRPTAGLTAQQPKVLPASKASDATEQYDSLIS